VEGATAEDIALRCWRMADYIAQFVHDLTSLTQVFASEFADLAPSQPGFDDLPTVELPNNYIPGR
jgi:hypothetical protein